MTARHLAIAYLTLMGLAANCRAESHLPKFDDVQLHGFLTQGFVKTDHNRFFGPSDKGSFEFTEIGLNASYRPLPSLLLTGQALSRRAGSLYNGSPSVDFALARWQPVANEKYQFAVSIGRIKNPIGFYNTTRDVAHTRPSIFLPQSVYDDKIRNLLLSSDGVMAHLSGFASFGEIALDIGIGEPILDDTVETVVLGRNWPGHLEATRPIGLGQLRFTTLDERWRAALSYTDADIRFKRASTFGPGPGSSRVRYVVASLQLNEGDFTLTGEYLYKPLSEHGYGPQFDEESTGEAYYLQATYHLPRFPLSIHIRYEEAYQDKDDRDGQAAAIRTSLPASAFYSKSWTAGLRWDISSRFMLSADVSSTDGNFFLSLTDNPNPSMISRRWEMFSILASYRF